ncbi:MAG: bi-domain-containing oxidoreductase [Bacteroidetes bacterium]|nr:bi-domain-containing oxidoreductase [Bacteroidota bacterium]
MEQLTQSLKNGEMQLLEVPYPALSKGCVLVRNHYSLISAGTEGKTVKDARLGYLGKARARKEEVKKVIEAAKTFGLLNTYKMVMNKLDAPAALGYCCAGEVIAVSSDVKDFRVGDFVACGGGTANHAEVVAVPVNLCVKFDETILPQYAAFTTLGAIAMQGIRQADLRLGENCVVIGLGLIGQLTVQILNAAGVKTIGIDVDPKMVLLASENGCMLALERSKDDLENQVLNFTDSYGTDAVIITAGTDSHDPIDLAGVLCRKKGKVVVVGAVPTGFKRPNYFKKELDLRMSSSYGPGRYDPEYEEEGIDYPYAYVRWTENRNMQSFVELLKNKKIHLEKLLTHVFDFRSAPDAYQMIVDKSEPFLGLVLKYDVKKEPKHTIHLHENKFKPGEVNAGLIGAGSFGQNFLLPAMKGLVNFVGVATARANNARNIGDKYGFNYCAGNADELFKDQNINTIFIATRHDSHAEYVLKAMQNGKHVFTEKPLCLHESELEKIRNEYATSGVRLMVGFNRRFAPLVSKIKSVFNSGPVAIHYRVNAGIIPPDHWVHDAKTGGGRIVGELCHFIDLCMYLANSRITGVSAYVMDDKAKLDDTLTVNIRFANGSVANVSYFSNGNKNLEKEYLEVFGNGMVARLEDFKMLTIFGKSENRQTAALDKGHKAEMEAFIRAVKSGEPTPVSFDDIVLSTLATFKVIESISQKGKEISVEL